MNKWIKRVGLALVILVLVVIGGFNIYASDFYRASDYVDDYIQSSGLEIETEDNLTTVYPKDNNNQKGIIFYPGGKVEAKAYLPLLIQLAQEGYTTVLIEMPLNLAVFNINGAEEVLDLSLEVDEWYVVGHSLGGAMASSYMEDNYDKFEGFVLLGSYPVNDAPIETMVIYGTYDIMLDLDEVAKADQVYEIVNGNHAWFGDYGQQEGDGVALISHEEQQSQTVKKIVEFIENKEKT